MDRGSGREDEGKGKRVKSGERDHDGLDHDGLDHDGLP